MRDAQTPALAPTNQDFSHLSALYARLENERKRLAKATNAQETALRTVWVQGIEKEIAAEYAFLCLEPPDPVEMSDDELLAALAE